MEETARGQDGTSQGHETAGGTGVLINRWRMHRTRYDNHDSARPIFNTAVGSKAGNFTEHTGASYKRRLVYKTGLNIQIDFFFHKDYFQRQGV